MDKGAFSAAGLVLTVCEMVGKAKTALGGSGMTGLTAVARLRGNISQIIGQPRVQPKAFYVPLKHYQERLMIDSEWYWQRLSVVVGLLLELSNAHGGTFAGFLLYRAVVEEVMRTCFMMHGELLSRSRQCLRQCGCIWRLGCLFGHLTPVERDRDLPAMDEIVLINEDN